MPISNKISNLNNELNLLIKRKVYIESRLHELQSKIYNSSFIDVLFLKRFFYMREYKSLSQEYGKTTFSSEIQGRIDNLQKEISRLEFEALSPKGKAKSMIDQIKLIVKERKSSLDESWGAKAKRLLKEWESEIRIYFGAEEVVEIDNYISRVKDAESEALEKFFKRARSQSTTFHSSNNEEESNACDYCNRLVYDSNRKHFVDNIPGVCPLCLGSGISTPDNGSVFSSGSCSHCHGSGKCRCCDGKGSI